MPDAQRDNDEPDNNVNECHVIRSSTVIQVWQCVNSPSHPCCVCVFFRLYSGSLVHAIAHELMRGIEPETLLTGASLAVELYQNLQAAVEHELDNDFIVRMRTRAGPRERRACSDPADELSKIFKHLMDDEEDDDDGDKVYEETCNRRIRHVSRAHTEDPRAKKCELVKWC